MKIKQNVFQTVDKMKDLPQEEDVLVFLVSINTMVLIVSNVQKDLIGNIINVFANGDLP